MRWGRRRWKSYDAPSDLIEAKPTSLQRIESVGR
jgi:hypothetical protein